MWRLLFFFGHLHSQNGIIHEVTSLYPPQYNGVANVKSNIEVNDEFNVVKF